MVNRIYLTFYLICHGTSFSLALLAANLTSQHHPFIYTFTIAICGLLFTFLPLTLSKTLYIRDFSYSQSSLPKKLQILPQLYRFLLLYAIPFMLLAFIARNFSVVFTLINFFALILIAHTLLFPLGTDDLSCRLISTTLLLIVSGYYSTPLTWFLTAAAIALMLSSITIFLLMHQYHKDDKAKVLTILKICSKTNIIIFLSAGVVSFLVTLVLFSVLPRSFIKDLPGNSVSLELLIPRLFETSFVGLIIYSVISIVIILLLIHLVAKYFRPKVGKHALKVKLACQVDALELLSEQQSYQSQDWAGKRKLIITNYLAIRNLLKKHGFLIKDSMTPIELARLMGGKIKEIKTDMERITRVFQWARYSKSKPTDNEAEVSLLLTKTIKEKINHFFKD